MCLVCTWDVAHIQIWGWHICQQLSFSKLNSIESTDFIEFVEDYYSNFRFQNT